MDIEQQIGWLVANTSATNTIIRALADAARDDPAFLEALTAQYQRRESIFLASTMQDGAIAEYEKALKELLPVSVRTKLFP